MYKPSQRQNIFAAHSSVKDMPPLAPPDEEMAIVLTAPMIRHMQRDVPEKKKSKPRLGKDCFGARQSIIHLSLSLSRTS